MKSEKLELTWVGKNYRRRVEPRVLVQEPDLEHHSQTRGFEDIYDNVLIQGDNLLGLKALLPKYANQVKCIYIDPPYNTGSAFKHYDDGVEHSEWLTMMRDRAELLMDLLCDEGVMFVSIDEDEGFYLKVLLDGIFGRENFCGHIVWEKKKKPSFLNANMGVVTEFILCYAKRRSNSPPFVAGSTQVGKKFPLNNAGNSIKVLEFPADSVVFRCEDRCFEPQDMSEGNIITRLLDHVQVINGRNLRPFRLEGEWRYSQRKLDEILANGESIIISKSPFRPNHVKSGGEPKKLKNLLSASHYDMATYEDATEESRSLFGSQAAFDYPKPERLIATLIGAVTKPGDLVLDSFAGSGTTGAVAHKMGRRWIMVEMGDHAVTHIVPRLRRVIDGADPGGVTEATDWKGGGGFRFYRLAPSLLKQDRWGNHVINPLYNAERLAQALCLHEGFTYAPSATEFWNQGTATETCHLYVTTQHLSDEQFAALSEEVGPHRSLRILCLSYTGRPETYENLEVRRIPTEILSRCEWDHDDYSLAIANLPAREPDAEPNPAATSRPSARPRQGETPDLFTEGSTSGYDDDTNGSVDA